MITLAFFVLLVVVMIKMIILAVKAAWGITKIVCAIVFLPIALIVLALTGSIALAIICLVCVGAFTLVVKPA